MAYQINKTDGTTLATVSDGQVDSITTDLTLIGKNYSGFGESLNENFIKLLENFANVSKPTTPIRGQIWFDVTELKLKVYNGTAFQPVSSATISATQPTTLTPGDLWFNDTDKQLYFYDGINTLLLGPQFSSSQGLSGVKVSTILDTLNQSKVITLFYNNGTLIGIFSSSTTTFTPKIPISGFSGNISPGFNAGSLEGIKFNVTATNSESLGGRPDTTYVRNDTNGLVNGRLGVTLGVEIGDTQQVKLSAPSGELLLQNVAQNKNIRISARRGSIQDDAILIESANQTLKIYDGFTTSETIVGGNLTVDGNLTVAGTTTTVNSTTLLVEDKSIELAKLDTPTDAYADGGGIILRGSESTAAMAGSNISGTTLTVGTLSSGTIIPWMLLSGNGIEPDTYIVSNILGGSASGSTWTVSKSQAVSSTTITGTKTGHTLLWTANSQAWNSSEHINLAEDKYFAIGGVPLLEKNGATYRLTSAVTSATGISIYGIQAEFTVDNLYQNDSRISVLNSAGDLELEPTTGSDVALIGSPKITGLGEPTTTSDAATKNYVDTQLKARSLAFTMDISDGISNAGIEGWLTQLAPVLEYANGTVARILCTVSSNLTTDIDLNANLNLSTDTFNTPASTADAVIGVSFSTVTIPAPAVNLTRLIKTFQIIGGAWTFVS
jgi:hypothetical protein